MCSCAKHTADGATTAVEPGALTLKVKDMTCGHCATRIIGAIQGAFPGSRVTADPASKLVSVGGAADAAGVAAAVRDAGYTPAMA